MPSFRLHLTEFEQLTLDDQARLLLGLRPLFANMRNARFLTYVMPQRMDALIKHRAELAAAAPHAWQKAGLREEVQRIQRTKKESQRYAITHYLIIEDESFGENDLGAYGIWAEPETPPIPLEGIYQEGLQRLEPVVDTRHGRRTDPTRPLATILSSYQFQQRCDQRQPFINLLLEADGPLILSLDLKHVDPWRAETAVNGWSASLQEAQGSGAQTARKAFEAGSFALAQGNESIFMARVSFMVLERDPKVLAERAKTLRRKLISTMKLDTLRGYQQAAATLFTPTTDEAKLPNGHHNVLSSFPMIASAMWGYTSEQLEEGVFVGETLSLHGGSHRGFYYMRGWQAQRANHLNAFGKTGMGKSTNLRALAARFAEQGTGVIVFDPQPHVRKLVGMFDAETVDHHRMGYGLMQFNPLDVVWDRFEAQADYVRAILRILLNPDGDRPRTFSIAEIAAIDAALKLTYEGYEWEALHAQTAVAPILELFCFRLSQLRGEAALLGKEIADLYVHGVRAATFNVPSTLRLKLDKPVTVFDFSPLFSGTESSLSALSYFITLSAVYREVRRRPNHPQLVMIDEFGAMMREKSLLNQLYVMFKTFRTFKGGMWLLDQDPFTLMGIGDSQLSGQGEARDMEMRKAIVRQTTRTVAFGMDYDNARQLQAVYPGQILSSHVDFLARLAAEGRGATAVLRADGEGTHLVNFAPLKPSEARHLLGS